MPLPTPCHHQTARRVEFLVLATDDVYAVDVDPVAAAGARVEHGADAHPAHEALAIGQVGEPDLVRPLDPLGGLHRARTVPNHVASSSTGLPARQGHGAGRGRASTS